jgi:uncharacterized protein
LAKKRDKALLALQAIDTAIDQLKQSLENMPEKLELTETEAILREAADKSAGAKEQLGAVEHAQKKREDESARLDEKIKKEEKKLYAGTVNNPKELMSLQQEIKVLTDEKETVDTEYLIGLDELEAAQKTLAEISRDIDEGEKTAKNLKSAIDKKTNEIEKAITSEEEKRMAPLKDIDEMAMKTYEQMRIKGRGVAVAVATEGVCGGCHLENSEDSGHGATDGPIRRCEYCHRILITTKPYLLTEVRGVTQARPPSEPLSKRTAGKSRRSPNS